MNVKTVFLLLFLVGIFLTPFLAQFHVVNALYEAPTSPVTITPSVADTTARSGDPNSNFGSLTFIEAESTLQYAYVMFDLSSVVPYDSYIVSAYLELRDTEGQGGIQTHSVYRVDGAWAENTLTWNNRPAIEANPTDQLSFNPSDTGYHSWNVTKDVQAFVSRDSTNYGWCLKLSGGWVTYASKEGASNQRPRLVITWSTIPWPMYRSDTRRTGYSVSNVPSNNHTFWSVTPSNSLFRSAPVVAHGRIIVYDDAHNIYALDETTGATLWGPLALPNGMPEAVPAVADDRFYVADNHGYIYCYNTTNGAKIWDYQATTSALIMSSPVVANGKVYFGTTDNYLYAVNATNGNYVWRYSTSGQIWSSPTVDGTWIFFGCDDKNVRALNDTGNAPALKWIYGPTADILRTCITVGSGRVFFGSRNVDHSVYALNKTTGVLVWKYVLPIGETPDTPAFYDNILYINTNKKIYALNATVTPGTYNAYDPAIEKWSKSYYPSVPSAPAIADGKIFFSEQVYTNQLDVLDAKTGSTIWTYAFSTQSYEPVVADGRVFIEQQQKIWAFGTFFPPLTNYYYVNVDGHMFTVKQVINGTSGQLRTDRLVSQKKMNYTVNGILTTNGFTNITIPKAMLEGPFSVLVNGGQPLTVPVVKSNSTHSSIYFTYIHSGQSVTDTVEITGTVAVAEFSGVTFYMTVSLLIITTFFARRYQRRQINPQNSAHYSK